MGGALGSSVNSKMGSLQSQPSALKAEAVPSALRTAGFRGYSLMIFVDGKRMAVFRHVPVVLRFLPLFFFH